MFSDFRAPDLAARLRTAAAWPLGAYLVAQTYFTLYPLLAGVPRWLFEGVRIDLLVGVLAGVSSGLAGAFAADPPVEGPRLPAFGWLAALIVGLLLCGGTLAGMSFPFVGLKFPS